MSLVEELGERKIIDLILDELDQMPNVPIPFGDDVSAVDVGDEKLAVIKTDMLVGKTDVPKGMSLWQAARKAVVMNVSELAAKGVQPLALLASIGIPRNMGKREIQQMSKGLNAGAREYNAYVLGGDTNEASDLVISCTALGTCQRGYIIKRSGANPDDYVAVTGSFGKTALGLKILLDNLSAPPRIKETLVGSVLMPHARLEEGLALAQIQAATASIDSSDGLAWCLHEISRASNVGFALDNLPISNEVKELAGIHDLNPIELTLYGGEEYELVLTIQPRLWQDAEKIVEKVGGSLTKIGIATRKEALILKTAEKTVSIEARGWEHFKHSRSES